MCCCSDGGSSETHVEEYCSFVVDNFVNQQYWNRLSDVAGVESRRYMCEIEIASSPTPTATVTASPSPTVSATPSFGTSLTSTPSPSITPSSSSMCQPGWSRYVNDGSELSDSCVQRSGTTFASWTAASVGCPAGSHMLTARFMSPASATGLAAFIQTRITSAYIRIGASQSSTAVYRNRGWAWVDGTDASNLNCGAPNAVSCGAWAGGQPEYVARFLKTRFLMRDAEYWVCVCAEMESVQSRFIAKTFSMQ